MSKSTDSQFPAQVLEIIEQAVQSIQFGILSLTIQDRRIVQIERTEKFQISAVAAAAAKPLRQLEEARLIRDRILAELKGLQYGQVIVKMIDGRVAQIEKTEKRRFPEVVGLYGDGI